MRLVGGKRDPASADTAPCETNLRVTLTANLNLMRVMRVQHIVRRRALEHAKARQ